MTGNFLFHHLSIKVSYIIIFDGLHYQITKRPLPGRICPECGERQRCNFARHLSNCGEDGPLYCLVCFEKPADLEAHRAQCFRKFPCRVCGEEFTTGAARCTHEKVRIVILQTKIQQSFCDSFSQSSSL